MENIEKPKVALTGVGRWGKKLANELVNETDLCYLVHRNNEETRAWITENLPHIESVTDLNVVLDDKKVESVVIATPISTHFEIALQALQHGKNVLLEKPGGESPENLDILIREAEARNLTLQVGYEFTFSERLAEIKKEIGDKTINKISFTWDKWGTFETHPVINLLVHEISIAKYLGLNDIEITKYEETAGEHSPDKIHIEAKSGNTELVFDINRASKNPKKVVTIEAGGQKYDWVNSGENLLRTEIKSFVQSTREKTKPVIDGKFAKEVLEVIAKIPYSKNQI